MKTINSKPRSGCFHPSAFILHPSAFILFLPFHILLPNNYYSTMATTLTLTRPDDWHLHLRDGEYLRAVLPDTARRFARAIVMPSNRR
jgi:hypothetical protein